jgi:hypothetical protein
VQQVVGIYQCFYGSLNVYLDKYLEIIALFDDFTIHHVSIYENTLVNDLVQQASDFRSNRGKLYVLENRMFRFFKPDGSIFSQCRVLKSILLNSI